MVASRATPTHANADLIQLRSLDPVFWLFAKFLTPVRAFLFVFLLGVAFVGVAYQTNLYGENCTNGYFKNVSWSLTMFVVFPPVFSLMAMFYQGIAATVDELGKRCSCGADALRDELATVLNTRWIAAFYLIIPPLWYVYFDQLSSSPTWIWEGCTAPKQFNFSTLQEITFLGYFTSLVHVVLASSVIFFIRTTLVGRSITRYLARPDCRLEPFHLDGSYGIGGAKSQIVIALGVFWLMGIYVATYVFDKNFIQGDPKSSLPIIGLYLLAFVVAGCFLYSAFLKPLHQLMRQAKHDALRPLSMFLSAQHLRLSTDNKQYPSNDEVLNLTSAQERFLRLQSNMPEWPVNASSWPVQLVPLAFTIGFEAYKKFGPSA